MNTPIFDFIQEYIKSDTLRLHMPGHKGVGSLDIEKYDITEINGADSLYEAGGIIKRSEENASSLFEADTFYSTEGSSQCIRAMLYLANLYASVNGEKPLILAGRNVHKSFVTAAALLDFDISWIYPKQNDSILSCHITEAELEAAILNADRRPAALYITSPDYLGNTADISSISKICKKHGILLLVDNAHGAYLKFLPKSLHPIDLGADICCDSAHKTLPVLTGGAYLHIAHTLSPLISKSVKEALALFGSTSPSYLILQSLDLANKYISDSYRSSLKSFVTDVETLKEKLKLFGYTLLANEPLKLTIQTKSYGYYGFELSEILRSKDIECEFSDPDFLVMMFTPQLGKDGLVKLEKALLSIPKKSPIIETAPKLGRPKKAMSVREAVFSDSETIPVSESIGRVLASQTVGCPPAVPILVCGEIIDNKAKECFSYYGITSCNVLKK